MFSIGICDDDKEQLALLTAWLEEYAKERSYDFEIQCFSNGFLFLENPQFHLCFLDIFMPTLSGMEVAKELRKINQEMEVVFCTSSTDFALASYEVQANNYLVKPVKKGKFFACLDLVFDKIQAVEEKKVPIPTVDGFLMVSLNQICFVYVEKKVCLVKLVSGEIVRTTHTFAEFTGKLLEFPQFALASRSVVVNFNGITGKKGVVFTMKTGDEISASKRKIGEITTAFLDYQVGEH